MGAVGALHVDVNAGFAHQFPGIVIEFRDFLHHAPHGAGFGRSDFRAVGELALGGQRRQTRRFYKVGFVFRSRADVAVHLGHQFKSGRQVFFSRHIPSLGREIGLGGLSEVLTPGDENGEKKAQRKSSEHDKWRRKLRSAVIVAANNG